MATHICEMVRVRDFLQSYVKRMHIYGQVFTALGRRDSAIRSSTTNHCSIGEEPQI
jgi:hypothetical protein